MTKEETNAWNAIVRAHRAEVEAELPERARRNGTTVEIEREKERCYNANFAAYLNYVGQGLTRREAYQKLGLPIPPNFDDSVW